MLTGHMSGIILYLQVKLMRADYCVRILKVFAESYPGSAQFQGGRKLRKGGWEQIFPDINESPDMKDSFIDAVVELEGEGIISVKWVKFQKGNKIDALYLENPDKMYSYMGENTPEKIRESVLLLISSYKSDSEITSKMIEYIKNNYISGNQVLFNNYADVRDILRLSELTPEEASKHNIRALSVKLFNNSKRIERIKDKADRLCVNCGEVSLTARLGIYRNFPETTVSGNADIEFNDGVKWSLHGHILTLPFTTICHIKNIIIKASNPQVLSIENKETFYVMSEQSSNFDFYIYCSGRINSSDKLIFEILDTNDYEFYHSGDIDPDGLKIFNDIDNQLGGKLKPFKMDVKTYNRYLQHGYKLSEGALKYFERYNNSKLKDLAGEILISGQGVEQEIINYFSEE